MIEIINVVLIVFMLISAVGALRVKELVSAAFLTGCFSFFAAMLWALLLAADVSFTEALAGAGIATIFFLLALFGSTHTIRPQAVSFTWKHAAAAGLTLGLGILFLWGSVGLPAFGDLTAPAQMHVSPFYLLNTIKDSHTPNAVTAVVVDYRGFDTLIETSVIFTAGMACLLIMKDKAS